MTDAGVSGGACFPLRPVQDRAMRMLQESLRGGESSSISAEAANFGTSCAVPW